MIIDPESIGEIIDPIITIKKKLKSKIKASKKNDPYFDGYDDFVSWKNQIAVHTVKGVKPVEMISIKAPNQSAEELQYTIDTYKQVTLPVSYDFLATICRGLHDSNWSINYGEEDSTYVDGGLSFQKYLNEDIKNTPLRMSYESWFKYVLPKVKLDDSMGVIAFKPWKMEPTVTDTEGNDVIEGGTLPEPIPFYYSCDRVLNPIDWGYLLIEVNDYSIVQKAGKDVREGVVYELYDDNIIYRIEQTGKIEDWTFEYYEYYRHNLGYIPCIYLQGIPVYRHDGSLVYQSPFLLVTDILDEVVLDACLLRNVKSSSVYPQKVMIGDACEFRDPESGNVCMNGYYMDKKGANVKCGECNGTGLKSRTGALNTISVKGRTSTDEGDQIKPSDALAYISPSIDTPKFVREEIDRGMLESRSILHIKTTNAVVKGAEDMTATGMVMDEKAKYAFVKTPVDQMFDIFEFGHKTMGLMRYANDYVEVIVQRPMSYDFNTESDYINQIAAAQAAGAPPALINLYVYKFIRSVYYDNEKTARVYDLIMAADTRFVMGYDQINNEVARNILTPWQVTLHDSAINLVANLERANPRFLEQDIQVQIDQLIAEAQRITPTAPATARFDPASIIANANA